MKLKGINPLEQHVEKIVVAIAAILLLGIFALQFVGGGSTVRIDNDEVALNKAYEEVIQRAQSVQSQIQSDSIDQRAPQDPPDLAASFESLLNRPVLSNLELAANLGDISGESGPGVDAPEGQELLVQLPEPPAPRAPVGVSFAGTIDPLVVAAHPDLQQVAPHLPDEQPYDLRAVTVEATFDASELIEALKADPDGPTGPASSIPLFWWQNTLAILDVELWRQKILPGGDYGEPELAPSLPGRLSFRDRLDSIEKLPTLRALASDAREQTRDIIMPRFYHMIAGEPWAPPSIAIESAGDSGRIQQLQRRYSNIQQEIADLRDQLGGDRRGPRERQSRFETEGGPYYGQTRGAPGGNRPASRDGDAREREQEREASRRQAMERRLEDLRAQLDSIEAQLQELGVDVEGERLADPVEELMREPIGRLKDGPQMRVWAHDVGVEPGATYRYQMRIVLANPLFGYAPNLAPEARELAQSPTFTTPASVWSEPVSVDENSYLFVTEAAINPGLGGQGRVASARVELFRFYYGFWRTDVANLRPGDAVAGSLDLAELSLPRFEIATPEGSALPVVQGQQPQEGQFAFNADGWYLLDVAPAPVLESGGGDRHQAVLLSPTGELLTKTPSNESVSQRRERLAQNAEAGQGAAVRRPSLTGESMDENRQRRRDDRRDERPDRDRTPQRRPGLGGPGLGGGE